MKISYFSAKIEKKVQYTLLYLLYMYFIFLHFAILMQTSGKGFRINNVFY